MKSHHGGKADVPEGYDQSKFERPSVTTDVVLFTIHDRRLDVLLIRRKHKPCKGMWAFPGGFIEMNETLENTALRELKEETDLDDVYIEQLHAYGDPGRDPRTRVITVAYLACAPADRLKPRAGDDAAEAIWHPAYDPPELAFDHECMLEDALETLRMRIWEAPLAFELLPRNFTLTELRHVYEAILQKRIDTRTLKRRVGQMGKLKLSGGNNSIASHRKKYFFKPEK